MWAAAAGTGYMASSSPSKSFSSTCSSPGSASPPSPITPNLLEKKSMEEVWKDISLASLNDAPAAAAAATVMISTTSNNNPSFHGMILQDFLARPREKELPRRSGTVVSNNGASIAEETNHFSPLPHTHATILNLNSGPTRFQYIGSGDPVMKPNPAVNNPRAASVATPSFPSVCKKRGHQENNENSDNRRHKRMMKNRESAARSRARRQAYTNELELEIAHLLEENANLKRQQEKLLAAPLQLPEKNNLTRTLTAPF